MKENGENRKVVNDLVVKKRGVVTESAYWATLEQINNTQKES